ncbi:MAG: peptide chain release factor 1 [Clostridiales bacterium]|nr:peptide chain release factor 1 [Clostridiales bacterium]
MAIDKEKTSSLLARYDEIMSTMSDPSVAADTKRYLELNKELGELEDKVSKIKEYDHCQNEIKDCLEMLESPEDKEMHDFYTRELNEAKERSALLESELLVLLADKDPRDDRNVIMEIRAGAGGEEAALFADTLLKMYKGYCMRKGFEAEMIDSNETELGGFKEVTIEIRGKGAYSRFKFESGVHRVQRVPVTESGGRVHTSTATVAVLPEAEATDVKINPEDLRIDRYRASGAGGQHVNRTDSAIRITHIPTGIVVQCQDERSQYKNKDKAMAVLQSRLWEMANSEAKNAEDSVRRSQVGTGDRSERIRTYNYHQGRVSDHRIGLTLYKLEEILSGDLDEIINALTVANASDGFSNSDDED